MLTSRNRRESRTRTRSLTIHTHWEKRWWKWPRWDFTSEIIYPTDKCPPLDLYLRVYTFNLNMSKLFLFLTPAVRMILRWQVGYPLESGRYHNTFYSRDNYQLSNHHCIYLIHYWIQNPDALICWNDFLCFSAYILSWSLLIFFSIWEEFKLIFHS